MHIAQRAFHTLIPMLLGLATGIADPVRQQDIGASSPWAAHVDLAKVNDSPLSSLLFEIAGFDRIMQLQKVLKEKLAIDVKTAEGVTLATLHAAKGLEWDAVFCVGMHEGMLPITHADTPQAVAEERRLFYVGVTRARRHLTISWARARKPGGRQGRKPTRFLDPLLPPDHPARGGSVGPRPKKRSNVELESLDPDARAVFERLREWRSATAAEAKVPAYVVFTDATLLALAELRPADAHGLVGIPGIGQTKRERYGEAVLEVIAQQG